MLSMEETNARSELQQDALQCSPQLKQVRKIERKQKKYKKEQKYENWMSRTGGCISVELRATL